VLVVIFALCVGFLLAGGLWSNALTLFSVIFAALLATSYWEPLADWLEHQWRESKYLCDFAAIWLIFALSFSLLRAVTDAISKVKVRFKRPVDVAGAIFFACWVGWIMVCFTSMTLHTAPLAQNFLSAFPNPQQKMFFGLAPDRMWLGFAQKASNDALSCSPPNTFDPQGDFIFKYSQRRADYEKMLDTFGK
jgi:hypothetical protein